MKKIIIGLCVILYAHSVFASSVSLVPSKDTVGTEEQFTVDVMLATDGEVINAVEASVVYPEKNLKFIRAEEGKSIISYWITQPKVENGTISFAGIIPGGFAGVIDPFSSGQKPAPGLLVRLVFEASMSGTSAISSSNILLTRNDGLGTEERPIVSSKIITVSSKSNPVIVPIEKATPTLEAYVTLDQNLSKGKYTLIYDARDRGSGIKEVRVKEGSHDWQVIDGSYVLRDQSRRSSIDIEATNFDGEKVTARIEPLPSPVFGVYTVIILIVCLFVFVFFSKKIYARFNKKNNS